MSAEKVWSECLEFIKTNTSKDIFETWFKPIKPVKLNGKELTIEVPSQLYYEWLETHYLDLLHAALLKTLGRNAKLLYTVRMSNKNKHPHAHLTYPSSGKPKVDVYNKTKISNREIKNPFVIPGVEKVRIDSQLNPNFTFDNLVEGPNNRLAINAGLSVASRPGNTPYNPLFIYGGVGLGKTHIANAIGVEIKRRNPDKNVLYVSMEKFTQQYTSSVANHTRDDFIHFYQMIDALIVDDVQFLSGKVGVQKVFFQIFNHLHLNKKQLIFTSDKSPVDMQDVEMRLLSRFKWGLSAMLKQPDFETRKKIIESKLYRDGVKFPEDVIEYIAKHVTTNIREIEGVLTSIIAQAAFNHREINLELAEEVISNFVRNQKPVYTCDLIQKIVADYFNLEVEHIRSRSRKRSIVQARQISMYLAKKYTKSSLEQIGKQIGNRDHATVIYSMKVVNDLMDTDKKFKRMVKELESKLIDL